MTAYLFVPFALTVILGFPIWAVLALSSSVALVLASSTPLMLVVQRMFTSTDSFPLLAVPLFMVAGNLMETGGISRRLINFCDSLLGSFTGGLAMVGVLACMFFRRYFRLRPGYGSRNRRDHDTCAGFSRLRCGFFPQRSCPLPAPSALSSRLRSPWLTSV